ncbi:hypothetical protein [Nostoc sp.]
MNLSKPTNNQPTPNNCQFCETELHHTFVDLGMSPPCESYRSLK